MRWQLFARTISSADSTMWARWATHLLDAVVPDLLAGGVELGGVELVLSNLLLLLGTGHACDGVVGIVFVGDTKKVKRSMNDGITPPHEIVRDNQHALLARIGGGALTRSLSESIG